MGSQVEEVKSKVDIVSLLSEYIDLKKAGRNYKANCPFHGEKTPSFMVSPELQIYKCFGCSESGDIFEFLQKHEGMDFGEALKYLADKVGVKLATYSSTKSTEREKIIAINHSVLNFYNYILHKHANGKKILEYLKKDRGLDDETIEKFQLGFSPDSPGILYKYLVDKKGYKAEDLKKAGLFVGGFKNYDRFGGRVVFPLMDHRDNIVGFSGRILPWVKQDRAKYINSPETAAYSKSKILYGLNIVKADIRNAKSAVVVEGELDMISSYKNGIKNVVAIKGSALSEEQIRLISRFCSKIVFCLDSDFAGDAAAKRGVIMAENQGMEVRVARLTNFKDPDDAARGNIEEYKKDLDEAVGVWDFLVDSVFEKNDLSSTGKAKISREVVSILSLISDSIVQAHFVEVVARRLSVPAESVAAQLNKGKTAEGQSGGVLPEKQLVAQKPRKQLLEEQLVALFLLFSPEKLKDTETLKLFSTPFVQRVIDEIKKVGDIKNLKVGEFFSNLPKELQGKFSELLLVDLEEDEISLVLNELKILKLRHLLETLSVKIAQSERNGNDSDLTRHQKKFAKVAKKLSVLEDGQ
ncbi:DNA primase [Candidatus Microgenomates bacterium]|nr:DNA primase [Candidatus Microgenomates bacterium]